MRNNLCWRAARGVRLALCVGLLWWGPVGAAEAPGTYPQGSARELTAADLDGKSAQELKLMRNEIYARHGHIFKTPALKAHFAAQPWYQPQVRDAGPRLTPLERRNVALIARSEAERGSSSSPREKSAAVDAAPPENVVVRAQRSGDLLSLGEGGKLKVVADATATLVCAGPGAAEEERLRISCSSTLVVTRQKGGKDREIARLDSGVSGIDYEAVAGNRGSVELDLLPLGAAGGALLVVRSSSGEGDEEYQETVHEDLYVLSGSTLAAVLGYDSKRSHTRGPDSSQDDERVETELSPGTRKAQGVVELLATEVTTTSHRKRGGGVRERTSRRVIRYGWTGAAYAVSRP